jgi:hypothetical protein
VTLARRVNVVRNGKVIRTTTLAEVLESQLTREGIEITEGDWRVIEKGRMKFRPKALRCACGMPYRVPPKKRIPERCAACEKDRRRCNAIVNGLRCENAIARAAWLTGAVQRRKGRMPVCSRCAMTPEERSEIVRKGHATRRARHAARLRELRDAIRKGKVGP